MAKRPVRGKEPPKRNKRNAASGCPDPDCRLLEDMGFLKKRLARIGTPAMFKKFVELAKTRNLPHDSIKLCKSCGFTPEQALTVECHRLNSYGSNWSEESTVRFAKAKVAEVYLPKPKKQNQNRG
ncbi:MAG: hypothetical protein V1676_07190 [Candidatus Diapherotrites archaeon]